jgi:hypothetical protein
VCVYNYRRGMHFITGCIDHLYTPLITTRNYSATANLHTLQFTTAPAKPFPACCVLTIRSLATSSNSGGSSASRAEVLSSPTLLQNCLPAVSSETLNPGLCYNCQLPAANYLVAVSSRLFCQLLRDSLCRRMKTQTHGLKRADLQNSKSLWRKAQY